jgi:hypothetical protein
MSLNSTNRSRCEKINPGWVKYLNKKSSNYTLKEKGRKESTWSYSHNLIARRKIKVTDVSYLVKSQNSLKFKVCRPAEDIY